MTCKWVELLGPCYKTGRTVSISRTQYIYIVLLTKDILKIMCYMKYREHICVIQWKKSKWTVSHSHFRNITLSSPSNNNTILWAVFTHKIRDTLFDCTSQFLFYEYIILGDFTLSFTPFGAKWKTHITSPTLPRKKRERENSVTLYCWKGAFHLSLTVLVCYRSPLHVLRKLTTNI